MIHVADLPLAGAVESTFRATAGQGTGATSGVAGPPNMAGNNDFAVNRDTTEANIIATNAKILAGMRPDLYPLYLATIQANRLGWNISGLGYPAALGFMINDLNNPSFGIYAAVDLDWQPGLSAGI